MVNQQRLFPGVCRVLVGATLVAVIVALGSSFRVRAKEAIAPSAKSDLIIQPALLTPDLPAVQPILPDAPAQVRLVLRLGQRRVFVYHDDAVKASFPVAVGRRGWETPTGTYQVISMLENPGWQSPWTGEVIPPGPNNPLGERWIAFWTDGSNYIGFHGTPNRGSVGSAASHGCVRMYNEHIRQLYTMVAMGTPVIVEP